MQNEQSAIALILFRVGPVLCCAPADPVQTIISPPKLTRPPGSNDARPGIFYHANHVVSVSELRHRFGVDETTREQPGRLIITLQAEAFTAYWVDEIIEVIDTPKQGWSEPSSHLPPGVFSKTLLLDEKIYLFADFANFENLPESGYLSQFIDKLASGMTAAEAMAQTIEDTQEVQAESVAETDTETPTVTTNETITPTETGKRPDTIKNNDATTMDTLEIRPTDDKTKAQAGADQTSQVDELNAAGVIQVPAAPESQQIEQATPQTQSGLDADDLADASDLESQDRLITPVDVTETASVLQNDPDLEIIDHDIEADSTATTEITETIPMPVNSNQTDPVDEETEVVPAPTEKDAQLKNDPDFAPTVAPEPEREPEKPPFPWKNLAAAVVLFITVAGIGIYYSWPSSKTTVTRKATSPKPVTTQQLAVTENKKPPKSRHEEDTDTGTTSNNLVHQDKAPLDQDNNDYLAEIKPDDKGVTIVLHSPENEPVLKTREQTITVESSTKEDNSAPTDKRKKMNKKGREEIIHIVVKGDTLWAIAKHYVNNPYKYPRLAKLSKIKNPDRIYPGNRVRILRLSNKPE